MLVCVNSSIWEMPVLLIRKGSHTQHHAFLFTLLYLFHHASNQTPRGGELTCLHGPISQPGPEGLKSRAPISCNSSMGGPWLSAILAMLLGLNGRSEDLNPYTGHLQGAQKEMLEMEMVAYIDYMVRCCRLHSRDSLPKIVLGPQPAVHQCCVVVASFFFCYH
jgi:hypothetical protein